MTGRKVMVPLMDGDTQVRKCSDCRHSVPVSDGLADELAVCTNVLACWLGVPHHHLAQAEAPSCAKVRESGDHCGPPGKWFEPRTATE